jgi:tetratricopeptide (TPR) repeat protein
VNRSEISDALTRCKAHLSRSEFADALACCKAVLAVDAKNYSALVFAGKSGFGLGKHAQAIAPYRAAIAAAPSVITAYLGLLEVLLAQADAPAALAVVAQLLADNGPVDAAAVAPRRVALSLKRAVLVAWSGDLVGALLALDVCARDLVAVDDAITRALPATAFVDLQSALPLLPDDATRFEIAALAARVQARIAIDSADMDARLLAVAQLALPGSGRGDAWFAAWLRRAVQRRSDEEALRLQCAALVVDTSRPPMVDAIESLLLLNERAALGALHLRATPASTLLLLRRCAHAFPFSAVGRLGEALMLCEQLERVREAGVRVLPRDDAAVLAPSPASPLSEAQVAAQAIEAALFHLLQVPCVRAALAQLHGVPLLLASVPARHSLAIGRHADALQQLALLRSSLDARRLAPEASAHWSASLGVLEARAQYQARQVDAAEQTLVRASEQCALFRDGALYELVALRRELRRADAASVAVLADVLARNGDDWRVVGLHALLTNDVAELRRAGSLAPPDDYRPHFWLGEALLGGAEAAGAGEALLRAAERNQHSALIFEALGRYYRDVARDRARAQRCFAQATRLDSSLRDAADALAALFVAGGALPRAADVYAEAARQHPSLLWPWEQHAHHLRRCVREIDARDPATVDEADRQRAVRWASDALTSLQNALRVDEKRAVLWQALATTYSRLGKFAAAMKAARRAFELDGSSTMPQILLAQLLLDVGDVRGAAAAFGDAGDSVPARIGAADALLRWSVALDKAASVGRAAQARKAARRALEHVAAAATTMRALQLDGDAALLDAVAVRDAGARKAAMAHAVAQRVALVRKNATNPWSYVLLGHALLLAASLDTAAGSEVNATRAQRSREAFLRALRLASSTDRPDASLAPLLGALWVSLGVSCAESPLIAQHCFVHALRMDERSVVAWTNLGHLLASRQRLGLAADALERACVLKPTFAPAWVASGTVRELLASRLVGRRRLAEARAEWRVALHAYARAVEMAASDALTGALGDASPGASSVTSASGARAALRAARIGIASCTVALVRSGDKSVDVDRALLAVQQVSLEDAAPDVDVLNLLGVCSALRGQFEAAADAFRLALDLCAGASSANGAADFDLQRSLLPSVSVVSAQQRRAVLVSNAVAAALRAGQPTAALAPLAHEKDVIAAALALDLKTACRVALALARCVGRANDALALAKRLSERIVERSVHTLGEPATSATLANALIALSAACTVAGDAKASRECVALCCELFPDTPAAWRRLAMQAALDGDRDTVLFVLGNADYVNAATREGAERTVREAQLLDVLGERSKARALIVRGVHERPDAGALWQELWIDGTHEADGGCDAVRSDVDLGLACRAGLSHSARASWWTDDELSSALLRLGTTEGLAADAVHGSAVRILEKRLRDCGSWALLPGSTLLLLVAALRAHAALQPTDVARWQKLAAMLASWRATKRSTGSVSGDLRVRLYAIECQLYDGTPASALDVAECVGIESSGALPAAAVASVRARVECAIAQRSNGSIADALRAAIRRQPALAELWLLLGDHYAAVGQAGAAVACAETALALPKLSDRERLAVRLRLAHFQLGARAFERAAETAGAVAKQSPRCAVAHLLRAVALLKAGADASEIFAALQACLLLDSEQPHARFLLAFVLLQLGDLARAEAHAVRLLEAQPDMPRAAHMFARILTAQASGKDVDGAKKAKLLKRAEALLRRAVAGDANVADFAKDLAKVEKQLKESK